MKRLAIIIIVAAAIVLAFIFLKPSAQPAPETNLTISNFAFSEASLGPAVCDIRAESKIIFEGPIAKPTPCNGLTANYTISGDVVLINITTTPYEGFCAQVIADTFYKGSFDLLQSANVQVYYGGEKICDKTISITGSDKEQACLNSGGNISNASCCLSVDDFPETCAIGACGCSLENSHSVKMCDCGEGSCFNGNACTEACNTSGCPLY